MNEPLDFRLVLKHWYNGQSMPELILPGNTYVISKCYTKYIAKLIARVHSH